MKNYIFKFKGLLCIVIVCSTIFSIGSTAVALLLRDIIDVAVIKDMEQFTTMIYQVLAYIILIGVCYGVYATLSKKLICKITRLLRNHVFEGIFKKNISDFKEVNTADYLSALTNDIKNVEENYAEPLLICLQNIIIFITSFVLMFTISPLVLFCLFIAILTMIVLPSTLQKAIQKNQDNFSKKQSSITIAIKDFLSGFEIIRSYRMNTHIISSFEEKSDIVYMAKYGLDKIIAAVETLSALLGLGVQCSVLFVSAYLIITDNITAGSLVGLVQLAGTIVGPIQMLSQNIPKIQGCKPIIDRLNSFVSYQDRSFTGAITPSFQKDISIRNLQFGYTQDVQVIQNFNYTFQKGNKYAIIGKSGCGKTTLVNLLNGYYTNFQGEILYDGVDIHELDIEKLNELSSIIHQNVYMFDESIEDNITLHKQITQEALQNALAISGVNMFLDNEKELDSAVGENGSNLSGGQRQRVAVARALVQGKPILVLDEGTSAVDMQTAYDIESKLLMMKDLTIITITHSLNFDLLGKYDQIIFMEEGTIKEADSFTNLVEKKGAFYEFMQVKE